MRLPDAHDSHPTAPQTAEEAEFVPAYRDLDEADRVLLWSALLTEVGRRPDPVEEEVIRDAGA